MNKQIFRFLILVLILIHYTKNATAQQNVPLIYRISNTGFRSEPTGKIGVIDPLTQNRLKEIVLNIRCNEIELNKNNTRAFIPSSSVGNTTGFGAVAVNLNQETVTPFLNGKNIYRLKLSPREDGLLWVLLGDDNQILLLNPNTLQVIDKIENVIVPTDIIFSPDGTKAYVSQTTITSSALFPSISVFDTQTFKLLGTIKGLPPTTSIILRPMEMAISSDGSTLYIGTKGIVNIIDTTSLTIKDTFSFPNKSFFDGEVKLLLHPNNKVLYVSELRGTNLYRYLVDSKELKKILDLNDIDRNTISDLKITLDGRLLYISDDGGKIIIDTETDSRIFSVIESGQNVESFSGLALAGDFTIGQAPIIQTVLPTANQQLSPNQPFTITWQTTVQPQSFSLASHKIELSTDGGTTFNTIPGAEQLKADAQSFTWQVPNIEVSKAQIRVSTVDIGARRASSTTGNFTISRNGGGGSGDTQSPTVNFLSPKGGERFNSGDSLQISWTSSDNVGVSSQDLSLSTDGGATFPITLASGLSGATQNFTYQIPMTLQSDQTKLRLIVRDGAGNSSQAVTANNFSISLGADTINPTVTISQPSQSQSIIAGQPIQVKWQSTDNRAVVNQALLLSFDGGKTFSQISSFGATDNSFVLSGLDKLNLTTPQAVVKITAIDSTGNKGEANSLFTIAPAIMMASYQAKVLSVSGIGFMSNVNNTIRLFINDKEVTLPPSSVSNMTFSLKANKKKLGIIKGNNIVKLVVDGVSSNSFSFSF